MGAYPLRCGISYTYGQQAAIGRSQVYVILRVAVGSLDRLLTLLKLNVFADSAKIVQINCLWPGYVTAMTHQCIELHDLCTHVGPPLVIAVACKI